jgi:cation transport regulator ChaC
VRPTPTEFVFGYGSLVARGHVAPTRAFRSEGFVADLRDFRRCWGVAMNNRVTLPGYKYYLDERGDRPGVHVAFLDLRPAWGQSVNGVCMPVTEDQLADLDQRERNYIRRDVTAFCDLAVDDVRVWTYLGSAGGRRRLTTARAAGRAVIDRSYLDSVMSAFKRLGRAEYAACAPSLDPGGVPVVALSRHDLGSTRIGT